MRKCLPSKNKSALSLKPVKESVWPGCCLHPCPSVAWTRLEGTDQSSSRDCASKQRGWSYTELKPQFRRGTDVPPELAGSWVAQLRYASTGRAPCICGWTALSSQPDQMCLYQHIKQCQHSLGCVGRAWHSSGHMLESLECHLLVRHPCAYSAQEPMQPDVGGSWGSPPHQAPASVLVLSGCKVLLHPKDSLLPACRNETKSKPQTLQNIKCLPCLLRFTSLK